MPGLGLLKTLIPLLFLACLAPVLLSCGAGEVPSPQAAKLRQNVHKALDELAARLRPFMVEGAPEKLDRQLDEYRQSFGSGKSPSFSAIAVLDNKGILLSGRKMEPDSPDGSPEQERFVNYSSYECVSRALDKEVIAQATLYTAEGKVYMICAPVKNGDGLAGLVCLALDPANPEETMGVREEEFLRMSLN